MPLANVRVRGRRHADNAVFRAYGSRQGGTHSPSADPRGAVSELMAEGFRREGYPLLTGFPVQRGLIEVYPHPVIWQEKKRSTPLFAAGREPTRWQHMFSPLTWR